VAQTKNQSYNSATHMRYRECVQEWRRNVEKQEVEAEEHIVGSNDLGAFYRFVNKRVSNRSKIVGVKDPSGVVLTEDKAIANAFSDYFASVTVPSNKRVPDFPIHNVPQLNSIDVDKQDVLNAIKKLKCNLSAGPDGLPPLLFRRVKNGIAFPLALMFK